MILKAIAAALVLMSAAPALAQDASPAYQMDLSITRAGVQVASVHTQIMEDAPTTVSITTGDVSYTLDANLFTVQGDGDAAQLMLEGNLDQDGETLAAPRMTFLRGHEARFEIGQDSGVTVSMVVSPID